MPAGPASDLKFEIGHVLLIDIVGYSKLLINEQRERLQALNEIVRNTAQFRESEASGMLLRLPTGDGMALIFRDNLETPVRCALEISEALKSDPSIQVRMGIHSGPVSEFGDVNERENIAGAGINIAQRVMDCGDAGHILLSKRVAEDLGQYRHWQPYLHELGECEVKHGVMISVVNLHTDEIGNPQLPKKLGGKKGKATDARAAHSTVRRPAKSTLIAAAALVLIALVIGLYLLSHKSQTSDASMRATRSAVSANDKSIAVLPFESLSEDKANAYFAEGIQDEILARLSKIGDLKVISRTSTEKYKSAPDNLREIAQQLGVNSILEGSVQKSADQVRVNVQLINATTDAHLWAEIYDRKLNDIFAVESEIAKAIAETLQAKLTGSEAHAIAARPTENTEAHQLYLKGRYFWNKRTLDDLQRSVGFFTQAISADPKYALAYAGLADAYVLLHNYGGGVPGEYATKAKSAARKALELDATLAEAHASLGKVFSDYDLDFPQSINEFERAIALNSNYATAHHWYANSPLSELGHFDAAISEMKRAVELDPLSLIINADLGNVYLMARRYDDAVNQLRQTLQMDPHFWYAHCVLAEALQMKGDISGAIDECEKARQLNDRPWSVALLARAYAVSGRRAEAIAILEQLHEFYRRQNLNAYDISYVYAALGDKEQALHYLEKSYQTHEGFNVGRIRVDPFLDPLRGDPRFEALVAKVFAPKNVGTDLGEHSP